MSFSAYLQSSTYIDFDHPAVASMAAELAQGGDGQEATAKRCFEFVRDRIKHSWDHRLEPVTCKASDVLLQGSGYCYAKSHLLAALLRANGIAAGLCYQRLAVGTEGPPFCLHGLNAIFLQGHGWYRVDARGDKPGVETAFSPPRERLAFPVDAEGCADLPEIWAEPLALVVRALTQYRSVEQVHQHLPDIEIIRLNDRSASPALAAIDSLE